MTANTTEKKGDIIVWFSCGAASAVAAKVTLDKYGEEYNVRLVNNPVMEEDEDNIRFKNDVEKWLGVKIETAMNPKFPNASAVEVWDSYGIMAQNVFAPCTYELKKQSRYNFERENNIAYHVLGFTLDEEKRFNRFALTERENTLPVLIDAKLTKGDCFRILVEAGIDLPRIYKMGYPNANCIGCVRATSPTYWNHVRKQHPEIFAARAEQSRRLGAKLARVKSERIFLDELPEDAVGRPLKDLDFECGIFCEEVSRIDNIEDDVQVISLIEVEDCDI